MNASKIMQIIVAGDVHHRRGHLRFVPIFMIGTAILLISLQQLTPVSWQPESTNIVGYFDFKFKAKHLKNVSQPWHYTWHNSGTVASVEHMSNLVAGKGRLIVHDGAGNEVYSHPLGADGIYLTSPGVAGEWTIKVVFDDGSN